MSIKRTKECRTCGKHEPRGWTEASLFQCAKCKADFNRGIRNALNPQTAAQVQAAKAAQHRDPRAAQLARAMANDPRPAARGTQQDPISDPMHLLNPLNPFSPVSPLNPLNDWDSSPHRNHDSSASSVSSCDDDSSRHTSHSSGYESSSSDYSSSSYDSGSDSSSYSSGGCD